MIDIFLEQPRISNQRLNAYGKEIGVLIGIKKPLFYWVMMTLGLLNKISR
tara:strand:+ start:138 stop:287 length:150 start_codon:yes stop_codon:yes gene_type:complete